MKISDIIYSNKLSSKAKILYIYCFKENDLECQFKIEEARKHFKEGRDAILKAIKELEDEGYIRKEQSRDGNLFGYNIFCRLL